MKLFDADKTRMIGLPYGEKTYDDMLSRFHPIPERYGRMDGRTDRIPISISRVTMLTRDKNHNGGLTRRRKSFRICFFTYFDTIHERDGHPPNHPDRQTSHDGIGIRPRLSHGKSY